MARPAIGASRFRGAARRVRDACYAGLDAAALRRRVTDLFADAFASDASTFVEIDPASALPKNSILRGFTRAFCQEVVEKAFLRSPVCDFGVRAASGSGAVRLSDIPLDVRRDPYAQTLAAFGMPDDVQTVLRIGRRPVGYFAVARARRSRFGDDEVALLDALAPHLAAGLRTAALRAEREAEPGSQVAMLVIDGRGRIEIANAAAEALLCAPCADDAWAGVQAVTTVLRASLDTPENDGRTPVPAIGVLLAGRRYTLRAERGVAADGSARRIIYFEPPRPSDSAAIFHGVGLSPREAQIAGAVVRGDRTADIAAAIGVSPNTVKTHVRSIFTKLDVGSRRELARRFVHA